MNTPENKHPRSKYHTNLSKAITAYANEILPETNNPAYRAALLDFFATEGTAFLTEAIDKFAAGQEHYGGNFFEIDTMKESRAEELDMFNYRSCERYVKRNPAVAEIHEPK